MNLSKFIESKLAQLSLVRRMIKEEKKALKQANKDLQTALEAQEIIQTAAADMQNKVHQKITQLVTHCLQMIFGLSYAFAIEFVQKRGKTEARMMFLIDGEETDPTTEAGGGVVDVAAFALRLAALLLSKPKPAKVLILDEPFRFVSRNHGEKVRALIESLSADMGIQFIIVTHDEQLQAGKVIRL